MYHLETKPCQAKMFDSTKLAFDGLAVQPIIEENDNAPEQVNNTPINTNAQPTSDLDDDAWMEQAMRNIADFLAAGMPRY